MKELRCPEHPDGELTVRYRGGKMRQVECDDCGKVLYGHDRDSGGPRAQTPYVCRCGAICGENGEALDADCTCAPGTPQPRRVPVLPVDTPTVDPIEGIPVEYAKRIQRRVKADIAYLQALPHLGHHEAAHRVCSELGHDNRAGFCERCGQRTGRGMSD